jgi:hypothetical protein
MEGEKSLKHVAITALRFNSTHRGSVGAIADAKFLDDSGRGASSAELGFSSYAIGYNCLVGKHLRVGGRDRWTGWLDIEHSVG